MNPTARYTRAEIRKRFYTKHSDYWQERYQQRLQLLHSLKTAPCMDCGNTFPPYVMDFDHRDPATKYKQVTRLMWGSQEKMLAEIAKCDLVCANCHRIRTHITRKMRTGRGISPRPLRTREKA